MNWFANLQTRTKLVLGIGALIVLFAAALAFAGATIVTLRATQQQLVGHEYANALDLMRLRAHINGMRAALLEMLEVTAPAERRVLREEITERSRDSSEVLQGLRERNRDDAQLAARLADLGSTHAEYTHTHATQTVPAIEAGEPERARTLLLGEQNTRRLEMRRIAEELGDAAVARAAAAVEQSERQASAALRLFGVLGAAAFALALGLVVLLHRQIALPLRAVSTLSAQVAAGDLTVTLPETPRADEVGDLLRAFRAMIAGLRRTTAELHEGVGVLAASSTEILATTTQVAAGAAETATAVSETTATVEEVKQTAQLASQKARVVAEGAQQLAEVAQGGRRAVEQAIDGMQRIQQQMESIATTIVRLSEQGQAIGEIIAAVTDLAEQSNILAVNAAIEASRAGEQGKGFAVVAQEVRSLAEQSRQATAQVRAILGEVQRTTAAAVLATEQGHKAVAAGVEQSAEAAEAIRRLSGSIEQSAQAATQIAASSQQQMVGMDQVALAMENIRQASSQNLSGTRQAEAAAQGLHELGTRLKQLAGQYRA